MYEFLLSFGVVLWLVVGFFYIRRPVASMYHPLTYYLLVHGIIFVIRPILAYHFDFTGLYILYDFLPSMEEKSIVLAGADLGLVVFALTSLKFGNVPLDFRHVGSTTHALDSDVVRAFLIACVICLPFGAYSLAATLRGTAGEMALDTATGIRYNVTGNGYFSDAQLMVGPICAVFAWVFRFKLWSFAPFFFYLAAKASTGGRYPFIQAFVTMSLLYFYDKRKKWPDVRIIIPVIGIIALFSAIGGDRQIIRNIFTGEETASLATPYRERPLESMDYANMEFFEYIVHVIPTRSGTYGYFLNNLQVFTEPVPRVLWKGKPLGAPIQMYDLFAYGNPIGMTMSVPGEGWAQGGWIGIILWCGLFGVFYGKMYSAFVRSSRTVYQTVVYLVFVSSSIVTYRDGVFLTILKTSMFLVLPFLVWNLLGRVFSRPRSPRTRSTFV